MAKKIRLHLLTLSSVSFLSLGLVGCYHQYETDFYHGQTSARYPQHVAYVPDASPQGSVTVAATDNEKVTVKAQGSSYDTRVFKFKTASGDIYNPLAMTASHHTLPLNSYVEVKNLENGRVAVVKINDRPKSRQQSPVQLSYAAAYKLGLYVGEKVPLEITPVAFSRTATKQPIPKTGGLVASLQNEAEVVTSVPVARSTETTTDTLPTASSLTMSPTTAATPTVITPSTTATPTVDGVAAVHSEDIVITPTAKAATVSESTKTVFDEQNLSDVALSTNELTDTSKVDLAPLVQEVAQSNIFVQVGAFRNKENASALVASAKTLAKKQNTELKIYESQLNNKPIYKVRFGPVADAETAQSIEKLAKELKLDAITLVN